MRALQARGEGHRKDNEPCTDIFLMVVLVFRKEEKIYFPFVSSFLNSFWFFPFAHALAFPELKIGLFELFCYNYYAA